MGKKFGERALNSTKYVDETITEALEETTPTPQQVVQPLPAESAGPEPQTATKPELSPEVETIPENQSPQSRVGEGKPKSKTSKSSKKDAQPEVEKTTGLNIPLSQSMYRRLMMMKIDTGKSQKSIALAALEDYLKKNGYK